jgi:hypothetical protein
MEKKNSVGRIIFTIGIIATILGVADPLEGSLIILPGTALLALGAYLKKDVFQKNYRLAFLMVAFGVAALFFISSFGGFGEPPLLSWWWGIFILPYPAGWILAIVTLLRKPWKKSMFAHQ